MAFDLGALFSTGPQQQATTQAQQMLQLGYGTGTNQLNTTTQSAIDALRAGTGQATGTLETSRNYWDQLTPDANSAYQQYSRLVSGDPAQMKATLEGMPGFQTALDIAQQGGERAAAAGGMGASGNALLNVANISRGLEDQNYSTYADQLWRLAGLAPQIAGAQTGISSAEAGLQSGLGTGIAGAYSSLGTNEANLTSSTAAAQANTYQQLANAQTQAASNVWNAILGVAGLGVKAAFPGKSLSIPLAGGTTTPA
jgi:hypothetical protein